MCQKPTWRVELKNIFLSPDNNNWKCTVRNLSFLYFKCHYFRKMLQWMPSKLETKLCLLSFSSESASRRNQIVFFADIQISAFENSHFLVLTFGYKSWTSRAEIKNEDYFSRHVTQNMLDNTCLEGFVTISIYLASLTLNQF